MKQIYFSDNNENLQKKFKRKVLGYSSYALAKGVPTVSNKLAEKILCTPVKSVKQKKLPEGFKTSYIDVNGFKVAIYEKGSSSKAVLFSHGWSGNGLNFTKFFKEYLNKGFKVITFDQIAHGQSEGSISNYYYFLETLEAVYNHLSDTNNIEAIIGHSMGTSALVGANIPAHVKLCFLAPVIPVFDSLYSSVKGFGLSGLMVKTFLASYEKKLNIDLSDIDPKHLVSKLKNPLCIIHSDDDQYIDAKDNLPFYSHSQKESVINLTGLGHFRILKSNEVIRLTMDFIND